MRRAIVLLSIVAIAIVAWGPAPGAQSERKAAAVALIVLPAGTSHAGDTVTLTADVFGKSGDDRPTGAVQFYTGDVLIGTLPFPGPENIGASLAVQTLHTGLHTLSARYLGNAEFFPSVSLPVVHIVSDR